MAQTYTTARGKTKKAKEGIRKDAKNNAATKLMTRISKASPKAQESVPITKDFFNKLRLTSTEAKNTKLQLMSTGEAARKLSEEETVAQAIQNIRIKLPSYQRCFYTECTGGASQQVVVYKHCANCRIARYCSPGCQKSDWRTTHKASCGKADSLFAGCSVAIRPLESYLSLLSPSLYPQSVCKPPCNEIHGVILSIPESGTNPTTATVEIFDADLIPTPLQLEVAVKDLVASGWRLEVERKIADEKLKMKEEQKKHEEEKQAQLAEEERAIQQKRKEKEERLRVLKEKRLAELQQKAGEGVTVDWSLFNDELDGLDDELDE